MNYESWVMSDEFKNTYKKMPREVRKIVKEQIPLCGSCGSGNHFWELQKDENDNIWFMIHSGSRKLGHCIAEYYNKKAIELNTRWCSSVPKERQLAFLPIDSKEGKEYIEFMQFACTFAKYNHQIMKEKTKESILKNIPSEFIEEHYINHNYASLEHHFGHNVWVHRKGATLAREGTIGIIPGSQGTNSYIVKGKGNKDSFESCSHGAGRIMSRTKAEATLNLEEEIAKMDSQGIVHGIRTKDDLDEAPGAYKPIDEVMLAQQDLVDIIVKLTPIAVIKDTTKRKRR
jgi:tRNA-splicing ligase RtcB